MSVLITFRVQGDTAAFIGEVGGAGGPEGMTMSEAVSSPDQF